MGGRGGSSHRSRSNPNEYGRNIDFSGYFDAALGDVSYAERMHFLQGNFSQSIWNALTDNERAGIYDYTGIYYSDMNDVLFGKMPASPRIQTRIDNATSGLGKMTSQFDFIAYRGDSIEDIASLLSGTVDKMSNPSFLSRSIGKTVEFKGFMSSAIHPTKAWTHKGVTTIIKTPKGTGGFYVNPVSAHPNEYEFLFQRGTKMRVIRIETNYRTGRLQKVYLEVVPKKSK